MITNDGNNITIYSNVSVVVPCFRATDTICRAVSSILLQEYIPREIILVDDYSNDEGCTLRLLYDLQRQYQNRVVIKVLELKRNGGPGSARNVGWSAASQPYIAFLDADDTWHPSKIRIQEQYMKENSDVAICGHEFKFMKSAPNIESFPGGIQIKTSILNPIIFLFKSQFPTSSVMLKSSIPFRFLDGRRYAEDALLWMQAAYGGQIVARINLPLVFYYKSHYGEGGLSGRLWEMEKGELCNYYLLMKSKQISIPIFVLAVVFSLIKYTRRSIVTAFK